MEQRTILGDGKNKISASAYYFNAELEYVSFAASVRQICDWAFGYCTSLKQVSFHEGISQISFSAFDGCEQLEYFQVSPNNPVFSGVDGVLYNKDQTVLIRCPCNWHGEEYTVPNTVRQIAPNAFNRCGKLKKITLADSVTEIGTKAFAYCGRLTRIELPSALQEMGAAVFADCDGLQEFSISHNPRFFLLDGCLAERAESGYALIQYPLAAPEKCFRIDRSVSRIHPRTFTGARNVHQFEVSPSNSAYLACDGVLFSRTDAALIQYPVPRKEARYQVPQWVRIVGNSSFKYNTSVQEIVLSEALTLIERHAFEYCHGLERVLFTGSGLRCIEWSAFCGCSCLDQLDLSRQTQLEICSLAFQDCVNLRDVTLPNESSLSLGRGVFRGCPYQLR